jgi:hypothetical protein
MMGTAIQPTGSTHPDHPVFATADGASRRVVRWLGRASALLLTAWVAAVMVGALSTASLGPLGRRASAPQPAGHVLEARRISHGLVVERDRTADRRTHARRT